MEKDQISVGYGRADITPQTSVPMGGYGNPSKRMSQEVRDPLYATCLAFTDCDGNTVLLFTADGIRANKAICAEMREKLSAKYSIPQHHIMIAGTHSHSTPDLLSPQLPGIPEYIQRYKTGIEQAADAAMAERKLAEIYVGAVQTERMNFVRHYRMADGTFAGSNFGNWSSGIVGHTSDPDARLQLIQFKRQGGKDIILMNWQAHACFTSGIDKKVVSADYIGEVRKYMEEKTGSHFAFFLGASGNHGGVSIRKYEQRTEDVAEYGALLGEYALQALEHMRQVKGGKVAACRRDITLDMDHSDDHLVPQAKEIWKEWQENYDRDVSNKKARAIGINSIYAIGSVLLRAGLGEKEDMTTYALRVGDLGFACAPYEMFGVNGQYIKERAPYPMTFVVTCCNDGLSYLASDFAFSHGCYEVDIRRYARGSAEKLAENFVDMLAEMKD